MKNHNGQAKPNRSPGPVQLEHIDAIEKRLWAAADTLRFNSNYASNEYFMPVIGLIFLRHAYSRYLQAGCAKTAPSAGPAIHRANDLCITQKMRRGGVWLVHIFCILLSNGKNHKG